MWQRILKNFKFWVESKQGRTKKKICVTVIPCEYSINFGENGAWGFPIRNAVSHQRRRRRGGPNRPTSPDKRLLPRRGRHREPQARVVSYNSSSRAAAAAAEARLASLRRRWRQGGAGGRERRRRRRRIEDDRGGAERPAGEEGARQVQRGRHDRRPEAAGGGADGDARRQDPHPEVVHHLQGPHHPRRLRDPWRHGPRALLQLVSVWQPGISSIRPGPMAACRITGLMFSEAFFCVHTRVLWFQSKILWNRTKRWLDSE